MASAEVSNNQDPEQSNTDAEENKREDKGGKEDPPSGAFECNICLDMAKDAVISLCGHLFCWPCLHTWLDTRPHHQICPVCKAGISKDKVIPLYGRGGEGKDPRDKQVPPRPRGQRPEPENNGPHGMFHPFSNAWNIAGVQFSTFGIGAFPFGIFATNFTLGGPDNRRGGGPHVRAPRLEEEQFLNRIFLWVAFAFIIWLFLA